MYNTLSYKVKIHKLSDKKLKKMKKLLFALVCVALPFVFASCDGDDSPLDTLTGKMTMVINGTSHSYTGVGSYQKDGKTYIATTDGSNAVMIQLNGTKTGAYTLGVTNVTDLNDWTKIVTGGLDFGKFENVMTFVPFNNTNETYIVIAGECNLTTSSSLQVSGTFKGKAIQYKDISNLDASSVIKLITDGTDISGTFTAMETSSIAGLF